MSVTCFVSKSLKVYQHLSLESADKAYQDAVQTVGI